ncbi:MAG: carboxypeptidase-like regulatory domain-containing protein, partial [Bacteroidota bacterium]
MHIKHPILILLTLSFLHSRAQNTGIIAGEVRDKSTQEALIGATVLLEGTSLGAQTDASGKFKIASIPPKSYNLKVQYVGYQTKTLF